MQSSLHIVVSAASILTALVEDQGILVEAVRLYAWLSTLNLSDPPSVPKMAQAMGWSTHSAQRHLKALEQAGWASRTPRWGKVAWPLELHGEPAVR